MFAKSILTGIRRKFIGYDVPRGAINRGLLFIHIPKAAGSFVSLNLYGCQVGHARICDYLNKRKNVSILENLVVFTVVREPVSRFISAYNFLQRGGMTLRDLNLSKKYQIDTLSIDDFLSIYDLEDVSSEIVHFKRQLDFLSHNNTIYADYIFRMESMVDLVSFLEPYGLQMDTNHKVNHAKNVEEISISQDSLQKIHSFYLKDEVAFGYKD